MSKRKHTPQRQSKASKTQVLWVSGQIAKPVIKPTQFETECSRLQIDPEDTQACLASPELFAWAVNNKNTKYVPEVLLDKWHLRTEWQYGERSQGLPRFSLWDAREALPVLET